jgi:hypothetical protein
VANQLFAIRVGSAAIVRPAPPDARDAEAGASVGREATTLIAESPIVTAPPKGELGGAVSQWEANLSAEEGRTQVAARFENRILFECHWPRKNQEFSLYRGYAGPCAEDFVVAYDGFVYAVATACDAPFPRPYSFILGREGRRILETILGASKTFSVDVIGPSPMFPVVYLCFADEPDAFSLGRDLIREGDTLESLYVLRREDAATARRALEQALHGLLYTADIHYSCLEARIGFMTEQAALYKRLDKAMQACRELARPLGWHPRGWVSTMSRQRDLRQLVGESYGHYVDLEEARAAVTELGNEARDAFARDPLLQPHAAYTSEQVADVFAWDGHHVLEALRFLAEESRSRGLELATWQGPLLGALIALAATALALWLGG